MQGYLMHLRALCLESSPFDVPVHINAFNMAWPLLACTELDPASAVAPQLGVGCGCLVWSGLASVIMLRLPTPTLIANYKQITGIIEL